MTRQWEQGRPRVPPPPPPELGPTIRPPPITEDDDEPLNLTELGPIKTTKQIHREYLQRTRVSKEDERRQAEEIRREEREERETRRKEQEKEKASNRARFLREKKKTKEQQERDDKRRQGLPTVAVHPSQATISGFARAAGNKRRIDETEEAEGGEQPPKRAQLPRPERPSEMAEVTTVPSRPTSSHAPPRRQSQQLPGLVEAVAPKPPSPFRPAARAPPVLTLRPSSQAIQGLANDLGVSAQEIGRLTQLDDQLLSMLPRQPVREYPQEPIPKAAPKAAPKAVATANQLGRPKPAGVSTVNQLARQLGSYAAAPVAAANRIVNRIKNSIPFFSSQDLVMSTQDIREIEGKITERSKVPSMVDRIRNSIPFLSTQDLVLSTQDLREIQGGSTNPPQSAVNTQPRLPQTLPAPTSKDEPDYDDDDFDEEEALELLKKVESSTATPALAEVAPMHIATNAPEVAAAVNDGNAGVPNAPEMGAVGYETLLGDGSWLSDDDTLDLAAPVEPGAGNPGVSNAPEMSAVGEPAVPNPRDQTLQGDDYWLMRTWFGLPSDDEAMDA